MERTRLLSRRSALWISAALLTAATSAWFMRAPQRPVDASANSTAPQQQQPQKLVDDEHARAAQAREKARASAQQYTLDMQKRHAERARQEAMARAQAQAYIAQQRENKLRSEVNSKTDTSPSRP